MKCCGEWPIGVCTWSLHLSTVAKTAAALSGMGLGHVHLDLGPGLSGKDPGYLDLVRDTGWTVTATMIGYPEEDYTTLESIRETGGIFPDATWERNRDRISEAADMTAELGVEYLTFHFGFLHTPGSREWDKMMERVKIVGDIAGSRGIEVLMETGQETAEELGRFLEELDHRSVGVNFDPANMVLYGMGDPVRALAAIGPWIRHVHIKDALETPVPGTWGTEVPWGDGDVDHEGFLAALSDSGYRGALAIERESGERRIEDIALAAERLQRD